jgi:hypothetical protein
MGFNARLAPYTVMRDIRLHFETATDTNSLQRPIWKTPFAAQLVGGYANLERHLVGLVNASMEATTNTGVDEISFWKHATADVTPTYITALRMAARTGNQNSSTGGGINWRLPGTSGEKSMYTMTNKSAARRKLVAGDVVMLHARNYGATDTSRIFEVHLQMDYIIGHEAS